MVVANLINMHSGFNGLQSGLSCIIITTVVIKSLIDGNNNNLIIAVVFLGGMLAFLYYNKYPSKIIEGNIGPLVFGACIGTLIIIKSLYFFGVFILLPHIADFLLWLYELIIIKKEFRKVKFGSLREDGTIEAPTPFKMKFLFPYYFRLKENQVVWILHSLTGVFCVLGLIIF